MAKLPAFFSIFYVFKKLLCVVCLHYRVTRPDLIFDFIPVHRSTQNRIINF